MDRSHTNLGERHQQDRNRRILESKLELPFGVQGQLIEQQKKGIPERVAPVNAVFIPAASNLVVAHKVRKLLVRKARARKIAARDSESYS